MRKRKGFALFLSMLMILLVAIIAGAVLKIINFSYYFSSQQVERIRNYYVVQAGKEYFLSNMRNNLADPQVDYGAASGNYQIGIYNDQTGGYELVVDISVDNSGGETYQPSPEFRIQQIRAGR